MIVSVFGFYNLGFNKNNVPYADFFSSLPDVKQHTFPGIYVLQHKAPSMSIRIEATFDEVDGIDYCFLQYDNVNVPYFVDGISMINENTCQLNLSIDALTLIGLPYIASNLSSGWCKRRHIPVAEDVLFGNTLNEAWSPQQDLKLDAGKELTLAESGVANDVTIIGSTLDLQGDFKKAETWVASTGQSEEGDPFVTVPTIPHFNSEADGETSCTMTVFSKAYINRLPNLRLFTREQTIVELSDGNKQDNVLLTRSLGLDMSITASYRIPKEWISQLYVYPGRHGINTIYGASGEVSAADVLPFEYQAGVRNKKVFSIFNRYVMLSICSGERAEFDASSLANGASGPSFQLWSDPSPNGNPYCRPSMYRGNNSDPFMMAIKGMPWQNTPIAFNEKSGSMWNVASYASDLHYMQGNESMQQEIMENNIGNAAISTGGNIVGGIGQAASGAILGQAAVGTYQAGLSPGDSMMGMSYAMQDPMLMGGLTRAAAGIAGGIYNAASAGYTGMNNMENIGIGQAQNLWNDYFSVKKNAMNLARNNMIVVPQIAFPRDESIQNYIGNKFYVYRTRLADSDVQRLDSYFDAYGYAVDEALTGDCFINRPYFNYVLCEDVNFKCNESSWVKQLAISQLEGGVRIWKVLPDKSYYTLNHQ